jgi:hypothetical protein
MADTSVLALDAVRLQRRLRMGKPLTFEKVLFWLEALESAARFRVVAIGEAANLNEATIPVARHATVWFICLLRGTSRLVILRRFCAGAAIRNSSWAPLGPRSRRRSSPAQRASDDIVEQDHRAIKRIIRPLMCFKDFRWARVILSGIELMHIVRKGQMKDAAIERTIVEQFYSLLI